jgi:Rieske Fe-S protein
MAVFSQARRAFIAKIILFAVAGEGLRRYLSPRLPAGERVLLRVARSELAVNSALVLREEWLALLAGGDGYYALSLVCTHLGCAVTVTPDGLACPCHGSRFDRQGRVLQGPADRPLSRYRVRQAGEMLEVLAG